MAKRQRVDIDMYQGDDQTYKFTLRNAVTKEPYAFNGASEVAFTVKESVTSDELFQATATDSSNGNDWSKGIAVISVTDAQSALLTRDGVYDLSITDSSGNKITPVYGRVSLEKQVDA